MKALSTSSPTSLPLWFAVLGAPFSWASQFAIVYWLTEGKCSEAGQRWGSTDVWVVAVSVIALAVAVVAVRIAYVILRQSEGDDFAAPPAGRTRFLSVIGMTVSPIFITIIVLNATGALLHGCTQS